MTSVDPTPAFGMEADIRENMAIVIREAFNEGDTWQDEDGLLQGEYTLVSRILELQSTLRSAETSAAVGGVCEHGVRHPHPCDECLDRDIPRDRSLSEHPCYGLSAICPTEFQHRNSWPLSSVDHPYCSRCGTEIEGPNNRQKKGVPLSWEPRTPTPRPAPVELEERAREEVQRKADSAAGWFKRAFHAEARVLELENALQQIATGRISGEPTNHRDTLAVCRSIASAALSTVPAVEVESGLWDRYNNRERSGLDEAGFALVTMRSSDIDWLAKAALPASNAASDAVERPKLLDEPDDGCWYDMCAIPHCDCVARNAALAKTRPEIGGE